MTTRSATHPVLVAWIEATRLVRTQPALLLPLGLAAAAKLLMVIVSLVAPFTPFSKLLAPVVRYFWGEIYLHYPYHLALATRWFRKSDLFFPILFEGFLVGMTAYLCRQVLTNHVPKPRQAFSETFRRYPATVLIATTSVVVALVSARLLLIPVQLGLRFVPVVAHSTFGAAFSIAIITLVIAAALEAFFTFSIPACILDNRSWFRAIGRSVRTAVRSYGRIFLTILAVSLAYLPFIMLRQGSARLVTSAWPESILLVYIGRILISWVVGTLLAVWSTIYLLNTADGASR